MKQDPNWEVLYDSNGAVCGARLRGSASAGAGTPVRKGYPARQQPRASTSARQQADDLFRSVDDRYRRERLAAKPASRKSTDALLYEIAQVQRGLSFMSPWPLAYKQPSADAPGPLHSVEKCQWNTLLDAVVSGLYDSSVRAEAFSANLQRLLTLAARLKCKGRLFSDLGGLLAVGAAQPHGALTMRGHGTPYIPSRGAQIATAMQGLI